MGVKIGRKENTGIDPRIFSNEHGKIKSTESNFMDMLKEEAKHSNREKLKKLLEEVDKLGARLAEDLSLRTLKDYRDLIRRFVYLALRGSYEVKEEFGIDIFGSTRTYKIVNKVDESLEELTQIMLKRHEAQIEIVSRVSEIRGLLVDLMG